jgi:hypothetical protein
MTWRALSISSYTEDGRRPAPRAVFTAACRAAVATREDRFARRIAVDLAADAVTPDSFMVWSPHSG